jgi:hypothetical protein
VAIPVVELLAAATETMNPIASALAKAREQTLALLARIRAVAERLPLSRAVPGNCDHVVPLVVPAAFAACHCAHTVS